MLFWRRCSDPNPGKENCTGAHPHCGKEHKFSKTTGSSWMPAKHDLVVRLPVCQSLPLRILTRHPSRRRQRGPFRDGSRSFSCIFYIAGRVRFSRLASTMQLDVYRMGGTCAIVWSPTARAATGLAPSVTLRSVVRSADRTAVGCTMRWKWRVVSTNLCSSD